MRFPSFLGAAALLVMLVVASPVRAEDPPAAPPSVPSAAPSAEVERLRTEVETLRTELAALRRDLASALERLAALEAKPSAPAPTPGPGTTPGAADDPRAPSASAAKAPAEVLVDTYRAYSDAELQDPAHAVTLEMVLAIVGREDVDRAVREKAAETVMLPRTRANDPTLAADGKGMKRPRMKLLRRILNLLVDADVFVRGLAKGMIVALWGEFRPPLNELDLDSCVEWAARLERAWSK